MSLAVALRLTTLFRLPGNWRIAPERSVAPSQLIDPCAMSSYLRRDIGLQNLPCVSAADDLLRLR
jgi:hypothetical protein